LKTIRWTQEREYTPGAEFAIPTFGSATHPKELARYMQMAQKLVSMAEIFRASIREHEEWASLLGKDIANQPRSYNELTKLIGELNIAATSRTSSKIHILDSGFIESTPLTQAKYSGMRGQHTPTDMIIPRLERLALEAFLKVPHGQQGSGAVDSFLQILGRQVMMSQVPTLVET